MTFRQPTPLESTTKASTPALSSARHCYLVVRTDREPPYEDDDVSDAGYEFTLSLVTAKSKEAAIADRVQRLLAKGFREAEVDERQDVEIPEWTDDWFNVTFEVFSQDEPAFWDYAAWEDAQGALIEWAGKNGELATQILALAKSGNDAGHAATANNVEFVSAVEKWNLAMVVPACTLRKPAGKTKRL